MIFYSAMIGLNHFVRALMDGKGLKAAIASAGWGLVWLAGMLAALAIVMGVIALS